MRLASHHRAITLCVGFALFAAAPMASADGDAVLARAIPEAADWAWIPNVEAHEDPFYDAEFEFEPEVLVSDPFEETNRGVLSFNRGVNRWFLRPLTRGYQYVVPDVARRGVRRAFHNFNSPSVFVNDLLQLRFRDAGTTLGRFALNSTLGLGGIFDVGEAAGWKAHTADFGQTLARIGVGSGPYLVLPIFGPNTVRDGFGSIVDVLFQPLTYLIGPTPNLVIGTGSGFTTLEAKSEAMAALEESSVDYYAALRSAYTQNRRAQIHPSTEAEFTPIDPEP